VDDLAALRYGERGEGEETVLKADIVRLGSWDAGLALDEQAGNLLKKIYQRIEDDHGSQTEKRIDERDAYCIEAAVHEAEIEDAVEHVEYHTANCGAEHIYKKVNEGSPFAVDIGAERREQNRHGRAYRDAHDKRQSGCKINGAGHRKGLQDTDGGRGALEYAGENDTHENAEDRMREDGEYLYKFPALLQRSDRGAHYGHAEHKNGEAH